MSSSLGVCDRPAQLARNHWQPQQRITTFNFADDMEITGQEIPLPVSGNPRQALAICHSTRFERSSPLAPAPATLSPSASSNQQPCLWIQHRSQTIVDDLWKVSPLLDGIVSTNLACGVDSLCTLNLSHLLFLQFGWLWKFDNPIWYSRA